MRCSKREIEDIRKKTKWSYPRIGIGVMIQNETGEILLGLRQGSHGAGQWAFIGGHLELGETIYECARREVKEEIGLNIKNLKFISICNEMKCLKSDGKHYVGLGVKAELKAGKPKIMEPDKFSELKWFSLNKLPKNIFENTEKIIKNYKAGKIYDF